jgi:molecular chaperone GrpE
MENPEQCLTRTPADDGTTPAKDQEPSEPPPHMPPGVQPTATPATGIGELSARIQRLQTEKQNLYDRLLRKQAELENFRKRTEREKEDLRQNANADLLRALIPTLDGFERALKHGETGAADEFYVGMQMVYQGLFDVLEREGLTPIKAMGENFDPHLHQAVECVEDEQHRDQEIVEELLRGYKFKHRLLRPSMVKVAVTARR